MYAVIRSGGKQYRVAPGQVVRVEKVPETARKKESVEFGDVLLVSAAEGQVARPGDGKAARVVGQVVEDGRGDKVLVFHYKRKKQFKRTTGHRQAYTAVRITEIDFDGQKFTAPELPVKEKKVRQAHPATDEETSQRGAKAAEVKQKAKHKAGEAKHAAPAKSHAKPAKGGAAKKAKSPAASKKRKK